MASYTENYNLTKPDEADYYDIAEFNANMDAIDEGMAETAVAVAGVSEKIGTPTTAGDTIFSLLAGKDGGLIRSIQRVQFSLAGNGSTSEAINTIDPSRSIVLLERLYDPTGKLAPINYSLTENSLEAACTYGGSITVTLAFWIVEFY